MKEKIGIIGLWHLGCVISASWYKLGHEVIGVDYDNERISQLNNGKAPLFEPGLDDTISDGLKTKKMIFSNDFEKLNDCDFIFLSYDTPVDENDLCDTSILDKSVEDVKKFMKDNSILIVSSQTPVGYCRKLRAILINLNESLELAYSPENLRLGEAIECYLKPGRIILGTANLLTQEKCNKLFGELNSEVISMSLESAEMVKHGINSFLAMSIVFANNIADICEEHNANIKDVVKGLKSDPRIGQKAYLSPGIGFSGGTLGRDLKVLESENEKMNGYAKLFGFIHKSNGERKKSIVDKIEKILGNLCDKKIGILGLTYKPGTSTLRRSLPLEIVELLLNKGAKIKAYDPKADYKELSSKPQFGISDGIEDLSKDADILVLLTDWPEFKEFNWSNLVNGKNLKIFDAKNFLNSKVIENAGLEYYTIGEMNEYA